MSTLKSYIRGLTDLVLPRECLVCGRRLGLKESHLCIYCMADFPFTYFWQTSHNPMADSLNAHISEDLETLGYEPYSYAAALFFYHAEAGYKYIPQAIKYQGNIRVGKHFGALLGKKIAESSFLGDIDLLVPVPLHKARQRERGYNQAEVIARGIASQTGAPVCPDLLIRTKSTMTQTQLDLEQKLENVRNAFVLNEKAASSVSPKHIALVDDVFTTGATICSCHRTLRKYFGKDVRISALTLGFVISA